VKDELARRSAAKAIMKITVSGGGHSVVREVPIPVEQTIDPLATLKARAPRKRRRSSPNA
jgi:hypothetical protein